MTEAWVTLATNDTYALGCLTLVNSLRRVGTTKRTIAMVTSSVSDLFRGHLEREFDIVQLVNVLDSDAENLVLIKRPDLDVAFTKVHCWRLTQFTKCVFLHADTLVLRNCDELFEREEFSAAPDIGWPDMFNSGVFVFRPSMDTYHALLEHAVSHGSFDGGDEGLLNSYFHDWSLKDSKFRLPFVYNMTANVSYGYTATYKQFLKDIKIVHFLGTIKPWHHTFNATTGQLNFRSESGHLVEHVQAWWQVFASAVLPHLSSESDTMLRRYCAHFTSLMLRGDNHTSLIYTTVGVYSVQYLEKEKFWQSFDETLGQHVLFFVLALIYCVQLR